MLPPIIYIGRNKLLLEQKWGVCNAMGRLAPWLFINTMKDLDSDISALADSEIMDRIYRQYRGYLYALTASRLRPINLSDDDIDDCVSFIIIKLGERGCRRVRQFKGRSSFKTYLTAVCLNLVKDYIKSELKRRDRMELVDDFTDDSVPVGRNKPDEQIWMNNPETAFLARERRDLLMKVEEHVMGEIEKLPALEKLIVLYRFQERMPYREIDELLGIKNSTYLFSRALTRLRNSLDGELGLAIRNMLEGVW
jgi:RNA polymerase sigma factor (sigma-70 family)